MTESFEDAIKALRHIARGNGSVLRIADRIVAAHERETKVEGVCGPITGELRDEMCHFDTFFHTGKVEMDESYFARLCDAIDSIHAQLERENADLRVKFINTNRHAQHVERENEFLKAELDRVHSADTWESVIYDAMQVGRTDATVDVTPLIERCKALAGEDR